MKPTPSSPSPESVRDTSSSPKATESADVGGLLQAAVDSSVKAEVLARRFHETYERLAPNFGYKTREASAKPWSEVPSQNKELMIAVCKELISSPNPSLPVSVEHVEQEKWHLEKNHGENSGIIWCNHTPIHALPITLGSAENIILAHNASIERAVKQQKETGKC